jgi:hypothetical protein
MKKSKSVLKLVFCSIIFITFAAITQAQTQLKIENKEFLAKGFTVEQKEKIKAVIYEKESSAVLVNETGQSLHFLALEYRYQGKLITIFITKFDSVETAVKRFERVKSPMRSSIIVYETENISGFGDDAFIEKHQWNSGNVEKIFVRKADFIIEVETDKTYLTRFTEYMLSAIDSVDK